MNRLRYFFYAVVFIPLVAILVWYFAIPENIIRSSIEDSISQHLGSGVNASINGFDKGLFFTVDADSLDFTVNNTPVLRITDISGRLNPLQVFQKKLAFSVRGKMGTGNIDGDFQFPGNGTLTIDSADINAITYLASAGLKGRGFLSADLYMKDYTLDAVFHIPDADIEGMPMGVPLPMNEFKNIQGAVSVKENAVTIKSISLEGDKGYVRLKGDIINGNMNMNLEIMPTAGSLEKYETMLLARFKVSPGYYVIPIKGNLIY
jgi:type II secretion system protein N